MESTLARRIMGTIEGTRSAATMVFPEPFQMSKDMLTEYHAYTEKHVDPDERVDGHVGPCMGSFYVIG